MMEIYRVIPATVGHKLHVKVSDAPLVYVEGEETILSKRGGKVSPLKIAKRCLTRKSVD